MNREYKYDYTLNPNADILIYQRAVDTLLQKFPQFIKKDELEDFDGTQIQVFFDRDNKIAVYNDYDTDAVYIKSTVNLDELYKDKITKKSFT